MCSDSLRTGYRRGPPSFLRPLLPNAFYAGWCSYQPFDVNSSGVEIIMWVLSRFISNVNLLLRPRRQSGFRSKKQQLWVDWQRTPFWEWFSIQPRLRGKNAELYIFFYSITDIYSGTSSWLYVGHGSWSLKKSLQGNIILRALRLFAAETFRAKRPQRRRAWRNGSFRRLFISLPFLHDYDVKMPNIAIYGERLTPGEFANIWQRRWVGIIAMKTRLKDKESDKSAMS